MALTPRSALFVTAGACVALALALLPPRSEREHDWAAAVRRRQELGFVQRDDLIETRFAVQRAEAMLAALELRAASTPPAGPGHPPDVVFRGAWDGASPELRATAREIIGTDPTAVAVLVELRAVIPRPAGEGSGRLINLAYLVSSDPAAPCMVVIGLTMPPDRDAWPTRLSSRLRDYRPAGLLGPCALAAVLGAPGPPVADWLAGGAALYAVHPGSDARPVRARPPDDRVPWLLHALVAGRASSNYGFGPFDLDDYALPNCQRGKRDACQLLLLNSAGFRLRPTRSGAMPTVYVWSSRQLMGQPFRLLSDLRREFGDERFGRFWRSSLAVDSAFAVAFGATAGDWMARWVRDNFGPPEYDHAVGGDNAVLVLILAGLLAGLSVGLAARRSVEL